MARNPGGITVPQWEDAVLVGLGEAVFAIGADVFEEQVGEGDMIDPLEFSTGKGGGHPLLVEIVWAGGRDPDLDEWQVEHLGLGVQERFAHAGDADAIVGLGDGGEESPHLVGGVTKKRP
jgi:hypothetical protein